MAGRKRAIPKEIVHDLFETYRDKIVNGNNIVGVKEGIEIWNEIRENENVSRKMTVGALYTEAYKWWKEINNSKKDSNNDLADDFVDKFNDISCEISASDHSSSSDKGEKNHIKFSVTLSYDVWETIRPETKSYGRNDKSHKKNTRTYQFLKPGVWTNILIERIAQLRNNIICTLSFKRIKVYVNGKNYLDLVGRCTTCDAALYGHVESKPREGDEVKFIFQLKHFDNVKHIEGSYKNVRIGGIKAEEIFKSHKTATVLKREMINKSGTKMFENPKGREVSANAIRCGQYRQNQGKKLSTLPLQAVEYLKESNMFGPMIHMVGLNPFFAMYGSRNQFVLYEAYQKNNMYTKVSCDATGSLVHKISNEFVIVNNNYYYYNRHVYQLELFTYFRSIKWTNIASYLYVYSCNYGRFFVPNLDDVIRNS